MRLFLFCGIVSVICASDSAPRSKRLGPEDSDLLFWKGRVPEYKNVNVKVSEPEHKKARRGALMNEVTDNPLSHSRWSADDYTDFASENVRNGGANHNLNPVTYKPIPKKYDIPSPEPEDPDISKESEPLHPGIPNGAIQPQLRQPLYLVQQQPQLRKGFYYQHYPYYMLPRQFLMRPQYLYTYPPEYQNVQYTYYHWLPYRDYYNIYRSDPRFNPDIAAACSGCGCGNGCNGGDCGAGCDGENDEEEVGDEEEGEDEGVSGDSQINKKDPLDDIDLEDLEKIEKAGSSERTLARRSRKQR